MEKDTTRGFNIIAAVDVNNGIGRNGKLPWGIIPADMHYFRQLTSTTMNTGSKNVVIMCRGTFESIGSKVLKGRVNIVVSRSNKCKDIEGIISTTSFNDALRVAYEIKDVGNVWVIGGEGIYREAIIHKMCNKLYITHIQEEYECDRHFPEISLTLWNRTSKRLEENGRLLFAIYEKRI